MKLKPRFQSAHRFLASIQTMYRMDRGDRIYVKRHFRRWFDVLNILEEVQGQDDPLRVLDVGCGSGFFLLMVGEGFGLDNVENVDVCRRRGLQAFPIDLEKDRFPFEDESFDIVTCLEVIEHLKDPRNALAEIFRVLKPNRHLLISTPNSRMPIWCIRDFLLRIKVIGQIYMGRDLGKDWRRYSKSELRDMLLSHGLEVLSFRHSKILLSGDDLMVIAKKIVKS